MPIDSECTETYITHSQKITFFCKGKRLSSSKYLVTKCHYAIVMTVRTSPSCGGSRFDKIKPDLDIYPNADIRREWHASLT